MSAEVTLAQIVTELGRKNLLPAIVFRSSRATCDEDVEKTAQNKRMALERSQQTIIRQKIEEICSRYDLDVSLITSHPQYASLINCAVGAHHAGQLLMWRLLLEELMCVGLLRILVATGTVAAGVDFPARTVIVTAHSRRGSEGFQKLSSAEFQQMSGRAGRRGKDTVGFCLAAPSRFCDARVLRDIAKRPPEPLRSSYFPSPSTVLNLLRYRTVDGLKYTVERSLAAFTDKREGELLRQEADQTESDYVELKSKGVSSDNIRLKKTKKRIGRLRREANDLDHKQSDLLAASLRGLETLGYVGDDKVSEKGQWAANLCTTLVIELAEIIEGGLVSASEPEKLVSIIASFNGDSHRSYIKGKDQILTNAEIDSINSLLARVRSFGMPGVLEDREVVEDACRTVLTWMKSPDWIQFRALLILSGVAEGDAARLITQTAEQLNQISRLTESHPELAKCAAEMRMKLLRPPLTEAFEF